MGLVKAKRECGRNLKEFNLALKYYAKSGLFTLCFELEGYLRATSVPYLSSGEFILQAGGFRAVEAICRRLDAEREVFESHRSHKRRKKA